MNLIVAVDRNWAIGKGNRMPWHIPEDMAFFKSITMDGCVIMGRKTFESLPGKKPLKGRENIVMTKDTDFNVPGVKTASSILQLFLLMEGKDNDRIFVIGGDSIYRLLLGYCKKAYVTRIDGIFEADTFFPNLDEKKEWKAEHIYDTKTSISGLNYTIYEYVNTQL
jgi:dihydrofolate reductase